MRVRRGMCCIMKRSRKEGVMGEVSRFTPHHGFRKWGMEGEEYCLSFLGFTALGMAIQSMVDGMSPVMEGFSSW